MFEHLKISKKLKQQLGKVVSIALSVAMLAGTVPADMLGGVAGIVDAADSVQISVTGAEKLGTENKIELQTSDGTVVADMKTETTVNLTDGTTYKVVCDDENVNVVANVTDNEVTAPIEATGFTATATTTAISVEITAKQPTTTTKSVAVTITDEGNNLESGKKITLKPTTGTDADALELKNGENVTLTVDTTYTVECEDTNVDVAATVTETVDGNDTTKNIEATGYTVTANTKSIAVTITAKQTTTTTKSVAVTITDEGNNLESGKKITLKPTTGTDADALELKNGENVTLTVGTTYTVVCDDTNVNVAATVTETVEENDTTKDIEATGYTVTANTKSIAVTITAKTITPVSDNLILDINKLYTATDKSFPYTHGIFTIAASGVDTSKTYFAADDNGTVYYRPGGGMSFASSNKNRVIQFKFKDVSDIEDASYVKVTVKANAGDTNRYIAVTREDSTLNVKSNAFVDPDNATNVIGMYQAVVGTNEYVFYINADKLDKSKSYGIALSNGFNIYSVKIEKNYTISQPTAEPANGSSVNPDTSIELSTVEGCSIYWAYGENAPTAADNKYNAANKYGESNKPAITETNNKVTAIAVQENSNGEAVATSLPKTFTYTVTTAKLPEIINLAAPSAGDKPSGIYSAAQSITLSSDSKTADNTPVVADIWYTTDGTDPKTSNTAIKANGAIPVSKTTIIKAYAKKEVAEGSDDINTYNDSAVSTFTYIIETDANKTYIVNPSQMDAFNVPETGGDVFVGTDNYFSIMYKAVNNNVIAVVDGISGSNGKNYDVTTMTGWPTEKAGALNTESKALTITGGKIQDSNGTAVTNAVKIIVSAPAKLTVYHAAKVSASTKLQVYKSSKYDNSALGTLVNEASTSTNSSVSKAEVNLATAGIYYIGFGSDGGIIPYMEVTENPSASTEEKVKLTFMNGEEKVAEKEVTKADTAYTLSNAEVSAPTKDGYVFKGWTEKATDATVTDVATTVIPNDNKILYAFWVKEHTVTLKNGTTTLDPIKVEDGQSCNLPNLSDTETDYFMGWKLEGDTDANKVYKGTYTPSADVTFNAYFENKSSAKIYVVTFDFDYKVNSTDTETKKEIINVSYTDENTTVTLLTSEFPAATRDGWTFVKWVTVADGVETDVPSTGLVVSGNMSVLAKWEEIVLPTTYNVTFTKENGDALTNLTVTDKTGNTITDLTKVAKDTIIPLPNTTETKPTDTAVWMWKEYKGTDYVADRAVGYEYTVTSDITFKGYWKDTQGPDVPGPDDPQNDDWAKDSAYAVKKFGQIPDGLWIAGVDEAGYTYSHGVKITPATEYNYTDDTYGIRVYHGSKLLQEKVDYTVTYKNNVNVPKAADADNNNKKPAIVVRGKGNYSGSATEYFKILPSDLGGADDYFEYDDEMAVVANNRSQSPLPTVSVSANGKMKKLRNKTDFTVKYYLATNQTAPVPSEEVAELSDNVKDAGIYYARVTSGTNGNYTGNVDIKLTVIAADSGIVPASKLKVTVARVAAYDKETAKEGFKPAVIVKSGSKTLDDTSYTLVYSNNTAPGTASVTVSPKAASDGSVKFIGSKTVTFKIPGTAIKSCRVGFGDANLTFTGDTDAFYKMLTDKLEVKKGNTPLVPGEEYDAVIEYYNNNDYDAVLTPTEIYVYIDGNGGYEGYVQKKFKVKPLDITNNDNVDIQVNYPDAQADDGDTSTKSVPFMKGGAKPTVTAVCKYGDGVSAGEFELVEGRDYTLSYARNKAVGDAQITVRGKGIIKGSRKVDFAISKKELSGNVSIAVSDVAVNNGGKYDCKPVLLDSDGVKLVNNRDYKLKYYYKAPASADNPAPTVEGDGGDNTTPAGYIDITKDINKYKTGAVGGTIKVVATGTGAYADTTSIEAEYEIRENNFAKVKVGKIDAKEVTGNAITLDYTDLKLTNGTTPLTPYNPQTGEGDFIIDEDSYVNNVKKGTAKVTLIGMNTYAGSKTITFKINAKKMEWWTKPATASEALDYIKDAVTGLLN